MQQHALTREHELQRGQTIMRFFHILSFHRLSPFLETPYFSYGEEKMVAL
jgi:hypothetical protein